jgi:hypothetical protein
LIPQILDLAGIKPLAIDRQLSTIE